MTAGGACRILLIGMMGSGKSTIGRLLSEATGWPYVDNDDLVRRISGTTARQLVADGDEAAMREIESAALVAAVGMHAPVILGIAAGTILDRANRDRLRHGGIVAWLTASPAILATRAVGAEHRPWLDGDIGAWFSEAAAEREPLFGEVADITIDIGRSSAGEAVVLLREHPAIREACADA